MKKIEILSSILSAFIFLSINCNTYSQTIRFQNSIRGGLAVASNGLNRIGQTNMVNTAGGVSMSSSSDLVLPPNSVIVKAILYAEGYANQFNQIRFSYPGSGGLVTLTPASPGFIGNPTDGNNYSQFIIDVTDMIPNLGYISTITPGGDASTTGRYAAGDFQPYDSGNWGYGWSLFVVYTNPLSLFRNVTIADQTVMFGAAATTTILVPNITVPAVPPINAMVAVTGCWGDAGLTFPDILQFGEAGGPMTQLSDPVTGSTNDILNSTIGFGTPNNVTTDGVLGMVSGNYVARNPYNVFSGPGNSATLYDCDIMDASGIINPSPTPVTIQITQSSLVNDVLGVGTYGVSVDIAACELTKDLNPTVINDGETAIYTFTIDNNLPGAIDLTDIGFDDIIPAGLKIANPNCVTLTGGTGGAILANPGSNLFSLSGLDLLVGEVATITLCVTNQTGRYNFECGTNPVDFTNGFLNIQNNTPNLANAVSDQCLIVLSDPDAGFLATTECFGFATQFTDTSFVPPGLNIISWNWNFGVTPTVTSSLQNPTFIFPNDTTYNVRLIVEASSGRKDTIVKQINVLSLPTVTSSGDDTICFGDTIQLNTTGVNRYQWTGANLINPNNQNPFAHPETSGMYTILVTDTITGCENSDSLIIKVNPLPIPLISGDTIICLGSSTTLNATGGNSYIWRPGNETTSSITVSPSTDQPYTLVANSLGCLDSIETTVLVETPPNAGVDGSGDVCNENNLYDLGFLITGNDPNGNWINNTGNGSLNSVSGEWNPNGLNEGVYTFDYVVNGIKICAPDTSVATVQVWEIPDVTIGAFSDLCVGDILRVPITISGSNAPFTVIVNENGIGLTYNNLSAIDTLDIPVSQGKTYRITQVSSSGTTICSKTLNIPINFNFFTSPTISVDSLSCNNINTAYQVYMSLQNGDINSYLINSMTDVSGTNNYVSNPINSGSTFKFWVTDINHCSPVDTVQGIYACGCESFAGSFNTLPSDYCVNETISAIHQGNEILDGNDTLSFVLHDKPGTILGNVIKHSATPVFTFDPATMSTETTYYVVAVAGDALAGGLVDLSNPNGCLNISNGLPVVFHDLPTMTMTGDTTICDGTTANLTFSITGKSPFVIDYFANGNADAFNRTSSGNQVVGPLSDSTTYVATKITDDNGCVTNSSDQVEVNVNPIPTTAMSTIKPSNCFGDSAYLVFTNTGNGPWSIDYTDGSLTKNFTTNQVVDSILINNNISTTYTLIKVSDNTNPACTSTNSSIVTFIFNPIPTAVLSGSTAICEGSSATINIATTGNADFLITIDDEAQGFVHNTATDGNSFVVTPTDTTTYTITNITDGSTPTCSSNLTSAVTIDVNPLPTLSVVAFNDTICEGDSTLFTLHLTSDGPYDITYSDGTNNTTVNNVDSAYAFYVSPSTNTTYTFNDVVDNDVPAPACSINPNISKKVVVYRIPQSDFGSDIEICEGEDGIIPVNIEGDNPGYNLYYTINKGPISVESNTNGLAAIDTIIVPKMESGRYIYQITRTSDSSTPRNCWSFNTDVIVIQVNPTPEITITGDTTLCAGDTLAIKFNFPEGVPNYDVDLFDGTDVFNFTNINSGHVFKHVPTDSVNFSVVSFFDRTNARCAGEWDMDPVTVNVNPIPSVAFTGDDTICIGQEAVLHFEALGVAKFSYTIYDGTNSYIIGPADASDSQVVTPTETTTYSITQMDDGSKRTCSSFNQGEVTITVRPLPVAEIIGDTAVCFGTDASLEIHLTGVAPFDITYEDNHGNTYNKYFQFHSNTYFHSLPVDSHVFKLVSVSMSGDPFCVAEYLSGEATLRIDPIPVIDFEIKDGRNCSPVNAIFINKTDAIYRGESIWNYGKGSNINTNADTLPTITYLQEGSHDVTLRIIAPLSTKCTNERTLVDGVIVYPKPIADFEHYPQPATIENNQVSMINKTTNGQTYQWIVYNPDGSVLTTSTDENPRISFPQSDAGEYPVWLEATSPYSCVDEITKTVIIEGVMLVNIPNSFTPNGDGTNDLFGPVVFGAYTDVDFSFTIYDRWGEEMFNSSEYGPQTSMWDGTFHGKTVPLDTYIYRVIAKSLYSDKVEEFYGEFQLLR